MAAVPNESTEARRYDSSEYASMTTAVVQAVASTTGVDVLELPPLHDAVDPDALDRLFERPDGSGVRDSGILSFCYGDCYVTVHASGYVDVEQL
jgi:hypothetical protein